MIKFFKNIFTPRSSGTSTDSLFADWDLISYEQLLEHFDVKQKATKRGINNAPASAATTPDDFHNSLSIRYQKLIATRVKEISSRFEGLETRADKALESINFLNDAKTQFTNQLDNQLESYGPIITDVNSRVRSLKQEVNEFKAHNNLTRDASYPDSRLWFYFLLLALLGFESVINGTLFASGSAQGILGGWSIAVLISAVNVVFGFMVGAFWGSANPKCIPIPKYINADSCMEYRSTGTPLNCLKPRPCKSSCRTSSNTRPRLGSGKSSLVMSSIFTPLLFTPWSAKSSSSISLSLNV